MRRINVRRPELTLVIWGLWAALAGCDSCSGLSGPHCVSDEDCSSDGSRFCDLRSPPSEDADGRGCVATVRSCAEGSDGVAHEGLCCPGQICSSQAGICFDKFVRCNDDNTCSAAVRGQVCRPMGDGGEKGCTFVKCGQVDRKGGSDCPDGTSCFNGYCVGEAPCKGACPSGSICTPVNNRCFVMDDPENPYPASCQQTCRPGTMLVFEDGLNVFNRCDRRQRGCVCEAMPPVRSSDMARHSSGTLAGDRVLIAAYDGDHGDLVVHEFDRYTMDLRETVWVDGIPAIGGSGAVVGDPEGPRSGVAAPGPDVGTYTSIKYDAENDVTHVSYYAATNETNAPAGDLKYAYRQGAGGWMTSVVDSDGDVGLYSSLALSPEGYPVIAYFQRSGPSDNPFATAVKVARSRVRTPGDPSDWIVTPIESADRPAPPCSNPVCASDQVCTASEFSSNGICRTKSPSPNDCQSPVCSSKQACVLMSGGTPTCMTSLRADTLATLPTGTGLFPSIAFLDGVPVVVWYDRTNGVLKGVVATNDSSWAGAEFLESDIRVLDDGVMPGMPVTVPHNDVGQFASVTTGAHDLFLSKRIAVAYYDATSHRLRVITANETLTDVTPEAERYVDQGIGSGSDTTAFVGADAAIAYDAHGRVMVAYQDSTANDLRLAVQEQWGGYSLTTVASNGAGGFYVNLMMDGSQAFLSHAVIKAKSPSESVNRIELLNIQTP